MNRWGIRPGIRMHTKKIKGRYVLVNKLNENIDQSKHFILPICRSKGNEVCAMGSRGSIPCRTNADKCDLLFESVPARTQVQMHSL